MDDSKTLKNIENRLSVLIALMAYSIPETKEGRKVEVILSEAGLENPEIAKILGKQLGAVQKTLQRAKK